MSKFLCFLGFHSNLHWVSTITGKILAIQCKRCGKFTKG